MAVVLSNDQISPDIYQLEISGKFQGSAGQFYMLQPSVNLDPFLPRPISIHDISEKKITFLYQKKGKGTSCLSTIKKDEEINLSGPHGNGFTFTDHDTIFVGGGIGVAPLYFAIKNFKKQFPHKRALVYLGFTENSYSVGKFQRISDMIKIKSGGLITEIIDFKLADQIVTCGPEPMMKALYEHIKDTEKKLLVSMERHMACGVGACLGCAINTRNGVKRVCKDGPVFSGEEVFYE